MKAKKISEVVCATLGIIGFAYFLCTVIWLFLTGQLGSAEQ